jgi:hypothetical protein
MLGLLDWYSAIEIGTAAAIVGIVILIVGCRDRRAASAPLLRVSPTVSLKGQKLAIRCP